MSSVPEPDIVVSSELAAELFSSLKNLPALALAVSGGADSLALLYLYYSWRIEHAPSQDCLILTVDHRLRDCSNEEARGVAEICNRIGLPHKILVWEEEHPKSNVQAMAREKRYELIESEMISAGIKHLLVAHHKNDQAETFLNRLARGSGVYGLGSMAKKANYRNIIVLRPLLDIPKLQLIATLESANWSWFEDETNEDLKYLRTKIRKLMPELEDIGITVDRLAGTAKRMQRVVDALNYSTEILAKSAIEQHPAGPMRLDIKSLLEAPEEIVLRLLAKLVCAVGGNEYVPRLEKIENLLASITCEVDKEFKGITLGGVQFQINNSDQSTVWLFREYGHGLEQRIVNPGETCRWDNRLQIELEKTAPCAVNICFLRDYNAPEKLEIVYSKCWPKSIFQTAPVIYWKQEFEKKKSFKGQPDSNVYIPGLVGASPRWLVIKSVSGEQFECN